MREGSEKRLDRLRSQAEIRAHIADAMQDALAKVGLAHGMSQKNIEAACEAAQRALESDVTSSDVEALKRIAENAAEESFKQFGFVDTKIMADVYVALEDETKARLETDSIHSS